MKEAWLRTRRYFWAAVGLFVLAALGGWLLPAAFPAQAGQFTDLINSKLAPLLRRIEETGPGGGVLVIFLNNLRAAALTVALGFTLVFPAISMGLNGFVVGFVLSAALSTHQLTPLQTLAVILPHGIFELPALFLATALGWRIGAAFWREVLGRPKPGPGRLAGDLGRLGLLVLGLLGLAAIVEIYVSGSFSPRPLS